MAVTGVHVTQYLAAAYGVQRIARGWVWPVRSVYDCRNHGANQVNVGSQLVYDFFGGDDHRFGNQRQFLIDAPVAIQTRISTAIRDQRMDHRYVAVKSGKG